MLKADYDVSKYEAKRGKKGDLIPLKFVMEFLGVSHRTAQDYAHTTNAIFNLNNLFIYRTQIDYSITCIEDLKIHSGYLDL